ncbi:hypothetical protein CVT24_011470 [Panaeolus cyanescens]|uniref:G-protein coupled receptors family 1 profile domain-containing protein n=1 Tax=Panaeolus cyanescens TaxID=181874 RepID=A0A409YGV9_9AGAR|nr:hypothetical protein CVT24_011470 [Panaeolus cyanescens]
MEAIDRAWHPIGETPIEVQDDATNLIGPTTHNAFTYGIAFTLYIICAQSLVQRFRAGTQPKQTIFTLAYMSVMFAMATVYCAINSRLAQLEYVNFRNYPGGLSAYSIVLFPTAINITALCALLTTNWMNDGLLLWRLWIIYHRSPFQLPVIGFGTLLYLATLGALPELARETHVLIALNNSHWLLFGDIPIEFFMTVTYYSLTISFTIIVALLLTARIVLVRRQLVSATGSKELISQYTGVIAIQVESSALYTIWGIIFLATYITKNPAQNIFFASLSEIQTIAPLLIIYRVSQGKAWNYGTSEILTTGRAVTPQRDRAPKPNASARAMVAPTTEVQMKVIHIMVETDIDGPHASIHFKGGKDIFRENDSDV